MAQLVEQLIRNQQVAGSSPATSSRKKHLLSQVLFSVIFAVGELYAQVRDMSVGRDMRFAR